MHELHILSQHAARARRLRKRLPAPPSALRGDLLLALSLLPGLSSASVPVAARQAFATRRRGCSRRAALGVATHMAATGSIVASCGAGASPGGATGDARDEAGPTSGDAGVPERAAVSRMSPRAW
jgi:hypothetical protein